MRKTFLIFALLIIVFLALMPLHSTQAALVNCGGEGQDACTLCDIFRLIANIINFVVTTLVPALAAIGAIWGGFVFLTAGGNPEKVKAGRKILLNTVIGLLIVYASFLIIGSVLGAIGGDTSFFGFENFNIVINCSG